MSVLGCFFIMVTFWGQLVSSLTCRPGFTANGNICYDFRPLPAQTWGQCNAHCIAESAMMVCIQDLSQQAYVWSQRSQTFVWVGAYKSNGLNNYNWVSGCSSTYSNWRNGESSNPLELYYLMHGSYGGQWVDAPGSFKAQCICQSSGLDIATYQMRNGFAFAALTNTGRVETWGEAQYGGNSSAVQSLISSDVSEVIHSRFSFVALTVSGAVASWGNTADRRGSTISANTPTIRAVVSNEAASALIESATGAVRAIGSPHHGGDITDAAHCPGCATALASDISYVVASAGAFVAVKVDASAFVWGNKFSGGVPSDSVKTALQGIVTVAATISAFAALLSTGLVVAWGDDSTGGDASAVDSQLLEAWHISSSKSSFVAYVGTVGAVVVWGHPTYADTSAVTAQLAADVESVAHTFVASAALKADGSVVIWGRADGGGDSSAVQAQLQDIAKVFGNGKAFAALNNAGGVVTWGRAEHGGMIPEDKANALSSGVVSIYHTDRAFAALKSDGSVVVWGLAEHGGEPGAVVEALLTSDVHTICANDVAFSAIKTDGTVVAWGHSVTVPTPGVQFTAADMSTAVQC